MNPETIQASARLWLEDPAKAKVKPTVKGRSDSAQVVLESGPFSWRSDLPPSLGGTNTSPSPTAFLLGALVACSVVLIRDTLAPQLGVQIGSVEAIAQCDADFRGALAMDGAARDLQNLHLTIKVQSPDSEENVQKLYQAWQERCPIYLAMINPTQVSLTFETNAS